jgi:hypothetical protein
MSLKNNFLEKLIITLVFISIFLMLLGCGSRKVQKSVVKESLLTEKTATEKKDIATNKEVKTVVIEEVEEVEVKPIDNEKEIIVNGKTYKNASVTTRKKKVNTTIAEKATVKDNSVKKADTITTEKAETKTNNTQRKSNPFLPFLWLLIPIAIYFVWKYKAKIFAL